MSTDTGEAAAPSSRTGPAPATPRRLDREELRRRPLESVQAQGDKESRGHILVVAGSREIPGAAVLTALAALRAGAGKLTIATAASVASLVALQVPEARVIALPETASDGLDPSSISLLDKPLERAAAVVFGPGLVDKQACVDLGRALVARCPDIPLVLDAGGMELAIGQVLSANVLLTPHHGEMAHLLSLPKPEVSARFAPLAVSAAQDWGACVALKAACTVVATPDGRSWRHEAHQPGLATSGSGDVLAGLIGGLAARGNALADAALWGVALHAMAGEALSARFGPLGFLARELAAEVPRLMHEAGHQGEG